MFSTRGRPRKTGLCSFKLACQHAGFVVRATKAPDLACVGFSHMKKAVTDRYHLIVVGLCIPKIGVEPVEWPAVNGVAYAMSVIDGRGTKI